MLEPAAERDEAAAEADRLTRQLESQQVHITHQQLPSLFWRHRIPTTEYADVLAGETSEVNMIRPP